MWRLAGILHLFIGSTLAGSGVIAALVMGYDDMSGILIAAALGFVVSFPVTWLIARQLWQNR
ncbi:CTP synthetase [Roseovarius sp. M141]|uniref:CTP synthetase n=1 Tax=Roseovarius sp. M141 TaxID=2583806 RepID=UPI0020CE62E6|nr:CTP synthetase [Roseovarius sp. M141]MCQ0092843.1 CTP synthetase [Roseovarius sp. M141]